VVAETCARADAWATALMVRGPEHGPARARREGLDALFMLRTADHGMRSIGTGALFGAG
jgi:thiamine biosynthesis lipoprotein